MKKKLIALSSLGLTFAPLMVLAQNSGGCAFAQAGTIQKVICTIGNILDTLIPILIVLGIVYFVWGVVQYVMADEEEAKKKGRSRMIYGIIGLVVIVGMWGLVGIITNTFSLSGTTTYTIPSSPI
ncbi:MAG: pilin [Minisyncoccia bacterium]